MIRMNANERWWERKDWKKIVAMKEEQREIISFNANQAIILQIKFKKNDKDEKKGQKMLEKELNFLKI